MQKSYRWYNQSTTSLGGVLLVALFMTVATILMLAIMLLA